MAESPFTVSSGNTFTLFLEPYLNKQTQQYQRIITFNTMPSGPIADMVIHISAPKLSPFKASPTVSSCIYVLLRYPKSAGRYNEFMTSDDIPSIFSYLVSHGYYIDRHLTQMIRPFDGRLSGDRNIICMATWVQ